MSEWGVRGRHIYSRIRRRVTYTNAALTLALVFAMTGGAFAASKYLITSTKQIKPSVVKQLKGKNGTNGTKGTNGAQGLVGEKGTAGTNGTNGTNGKDGTSTNGESATVKEVKPGETACKKLGGGEFKVGSGSPAFACNGAEGAQGPKGEPWTPGTLPSGKTETGVWTGITGTGGAYLASLSFAIPLATAQVKANIHYVHFKEVSPPTACLGTPAVPTATAGNLCIYAGWMSGVETAFAFLPMTEAGAEGTAGVPIELIFENSGEPVYGSFAVTAP